MNILYLWKFYSRAKGLNSPKKNQINFQFDLGFHGKRRKTIPVEAYAIVSTLKGTKDTLHDITSLAVPCASDVHESV